MSLTSVYLCTLALVVLIFFMAFMNRRSGWRKSRTGAVQNLSTTEAVSDEVAVPLSRALTMSACVDFTAQLVTLQSALQGRGRVALQTAPAREHN